MKKVIVAMEKDVILFILVIMMWKAYTKNLIIKIDSKRVLFICPKDYKFFLLLKILIKSDNYLY